MLSVGTIKLVSYRWSWFKCVTNLHAQCMQAVLNSPLSYFDVTPIGCIVNRFAIYPWHLPYAFHFYYSFSLLDLPPLTLTLLTAHSLTQHIAHILRAPHSHTAHTVPHSLTPHCSPHTDLTLCTSTRDTETMDIKIWESWRGFLDLLLPLLSTILLVCAVMPAFILVVPILACFALRVQSYYR